MPNKLKLNFVDQCEAKPLSKVLSVQIEREKEREIRAISKGLVNRINLQPHGQELLGLIGGYNDKNNIEAVSSWMQKIKKSGEFRKVIDCQKGQSVISRLALKIESDIQALYD